MKLSSALPVASLSLTGNGFKPKVLVLSYRADGIIRIDWATCNMNASENTRKGRVTNDGLDHYTCH